MKNKEVLPKLQGLMLVRGVRFAGPTALAMSKNIKILRGALEVLEDTRKELCEQYSDKDEKGVAIQEGGVYKMSDENSVLFNEEYSKMMEEGAGITLVELNFTTEMAELVIRRLPEISQDEIGVIEGLVKKVEVKKDDTEGDE